MMISTWVMMILLQQNKKKARAEIYCFLRLKTYLCFFALQFQNNDAGKVSMSKEFWAWWLSLT